MTAEFTGERVIPGEVDVDLWNEHISRYVFASRFTAGRRVLDLGCGAGYGSAMMLDSGAESVTALDVAPEALELTRAEAGSLRCVQASATAVPLRRESFDVITAFEVIEHLTDWRSLLSEASRLLAPGGCLIVSTPNKSFYAETRSESGPNPFHEHEFEYEEFAAALCNVFPHISMYLQDHTAAISFRAVADGTTSSLRVEESDTDPSAASFFVAVCSTTPAASWPGLVYVPSAANTLRERMRHISRLNAYLSEARSEHQQLLDNHRRVNDELKRSNEWASSVNERLSAAGARIVQLQHEAEEDQRAAREVIERYEAELEKRTEWALQLDADLKRCIGLLRQTEADFEARTRWALDLDAQREKLERELAETHAQLNMVQASRWLKLGRAVGLGPELRKT